MGAMFFEYEVGIRPVDWRVQGSRKERCVSFYQRGGDAVVRADGQTGIGYVLGEPLIMDSGLTTAHFNALSLVAQIPRTEGPIERDLKAALKVFGNQRFNQSAQGDVVFYAEICPLGRPTNVEPIHMRFSPSGVEVLVS